MEDYAEYLSAEAKSGLVAMHQFRLLYNDDNRFHLFFEGEEDSLFYMPVVRRIVSNPDPYIYVCGGKKNVKDTKSSIIRDGYDINTCLFFVDRDFDDYLGTQISIDSQTYITDNYSIENDIASRNSLAIIVSDVVQISRADPEFNQIMSGYSIAEREYAIALRPFMAWCLAARQCGFEPNIQNVDLKKVIELRTAARPAKRVGGFAIFRRLVTSSKGKPGPEMRSVLSWRRQLTMCDRKKWLRGKFELWFFQIALLKLLGEANARRSSAGGKPYKIPPSVRDARFFDLLGGRLQPPDSLVTFLTERLLGTS